MVKSYNTLSDAEHEKRSPSKDHDSDQSIGVTRRRFLAASASTVVGLEGLRNIGNAAASTDRHTLIIEGTGPTTSYTFTVGGNLQKSTASGASINQSDYITAHSAHGTVSKGVDTYTFTGALYSFTFNDSNDIQVTLDGKPAHVGEQWDHTLLIEGFGTNTPYSFATDGLIGQSSAYDATADDSDHTNGYAASGAVQAGKDAYVFNGDLLSFDFERSGELRVTIDGKPAHVGKRPDQTLKIISMGGYNPYEFSVSGSIRSGVDTDGKQDVFNEKSASGIVTKFGHDKYTYDGELTSLDYPQKSSIEVYSRCCLENWWKERYSAATSGR